MWPCWIDNTIYYANFLVKKFYLLRNLQKTPKIGPKPDQNSILHGRTHSPSILVLSYQFLHRKILSDQTQPYPIIIFKRSVRLKARTYRLPGAWHFRCLFMVTWQTIVNLYLYWVWLHVFSYKHGEFSILS